MAESTDWSQFVLRIAIRASRQQLYNAWATRQGMESWFLRLCAYAHPDGQLLEDDEPAVTGDRYTFRWHGWPDETTEYGEVLQANGHDNFQFSFGKAGICTVSILMAGDLQIVELEQSAIPDDDAGKMLWHVGCKTGWTFYMANLKSMFEGGIDLRNRDENLQNVLNS